MLCWQVQEEGAGQVVTSTSATLRGLGYHASDFPFSYSYPPTFHRLSEFHQLPIVCDGWLEVNASFVLCQIHLTTDRLSSVLIFARLFR
jgi:hypothetical protein